MLVLSIAAVALAAATATFVLLSSVVARRRRGRLRPGQRVVLNTPRPDDQSILGVVRDDTGRGVWLGEAKLLTQDADGNPKVTTPAGGDVFVARYAWAHLLPPADPELTPAAPAAGAS